jgi:hypothetical protein
VKGSLLVVEKVGNGLASNAEGKALAVAQEGPTVLFWYLNFGCNGARWRQLKLAQRGRAPELGVHKFASGFTLGDFVFVGPKIE